VYGFNGQVMAALGEPPRALHSLPPMGTRASLGAARQEA